MMAGTRLGLRSKVTSMAALTSVRKASAFSFSFCAKNSLGERERLMERRRGNNNKNNKNRGNVCASCQAGVQKHGFSNLSVESGTKAAALVIGNEILNGQVADTNLPWLAKMLYNRGIDMVRAEFVPDDQEEIAKTVLSLRERIGKSGLLFTSGGIGPTHDDVTYDAVARAFNTRTEEHTETIERMKSFYEKQGKEVNEARKKMARLPVGCEVLYTPGLWVPLAVIEETYILPGIPWLFQKMVKAQESRFKGPAIYSKTVYSNSGEGDLAAILNTIVEKYPNVDFGSYPKTRDEESYLTKLVLHSRDEGIVGEACKDIVELIPDCWQ